MPALLIFEQVTADDWAKLSTKEQSIVSYLASDILLEHGWIRLDFVCGLW